jgi:hypothetical protein
MKIQRVPTGLIDFLNLRSQGETPDELSRIVRPVLDISELYQADKHEAVTAPCALNDGTIDTLQVPNDQLWLLLAVGIIRDAAATPAELRYGFTWAVERIAGAGLNGAPFHTANLTFPLSAGPTTRLAYSYLLPRPFLLRPNQLIAVQCQFGLRTDTGAALGWNGDLWAHVIALEV